MSLLPILFVIVIVVLLHRADAQCGCHPTSYTLQINFTRSDCTDRTIPGPGVLDVTCFLIDVDPNANRSAPLVVVDRIETYVIETFGSSPPRDAREVIGPFYEGDDVRIESYDAPHELMVFDLYGRNTQNQSFQSSLIFLFSTQCGELDLFSEGDKFAWMVFVSRK